MAEYVGLAPLNGGNGTKWDIIKKECPKLD